MIPSEQTISTGLVIYDIPEDEIEDVNWTAKNADGSYQVQTMYEQFVWVPVSNDNFTTEFVREHFGTESQKWWYGAFVTDQLGYMNMYEPVANGIDVNTTASDSIQETQKMYKSVKDNKGFYIGRYEAGNDGSGNVLCKRGVSVYNNIGWNNTNNIADETGGAVEKARGFSEQNGYDSTTSTLVYGVQWDAVMRWISKDDGLKGYLTDSSQIGNYDDNNNTNNPAKTGSSRTIQTKKYI